MRRFRAIAVITAAAIFSEGCATAGAAKSLASGIIGGVVNTGLSAVGAVAKGVAPAAEKAASAERTYQAYASGGRNYSSSSSSTSGSTSSKSSSKSSSGKSLKERQSQAKANAKKRRTKRKDTRKQRKREFEQRRFERQTNHSPSAFYNNR